MTPSSIFLLVFISSGCGFLAQTLLSGFWISAFSDDIFSYSLHVAFFFLSLGAGAMLAERIIKPSPRTLFRLCIGNCVGLGLLVPLLKIAIVWLGGRLWIPLVFLAIEGVGVGTVVPLVLRLPRLSKKISLGTLFFVDYISALFVSCIFTFVLLIPFGFAKTGLIAAYTGIVGTLITWYFAKDRVTTKELLIVAGFGIVLLVAMEGSSSIVSVRREADKSSRVVFSKQSHYQKIVLMEEASNEPAVQGDRQFILYLDGFLQFASSDEQSYHACLANIPMMSFFGRGKVPKQVLILGGGDGLAARNILMVPGVEKITLVELDPAMIEMASQHPVMRQQNLDSLRSPRLQVVNDDAFQWIRHSNLKFDLVIIDFPLPKNLTLSRLYSAEFYHFLFQRMTDDGVVAIQAGPSFTYKDPTYQTLNEVTASILMTIESMGKRAWPYISNLDNEAFVISSNASDFNFADVAAKNGLDHEMGFGRICGYRADWKRPKVEVNTLNRLPVAQYMLDWLREGSQAFFYYRGTRANFLPE